MLLSSPTPLLFGSLPGDPDPPRDIPLSQVGCEFKRMTSLVGSLRSELDCAEAETARLDTERVDALAETRDVLDQLADLQSEYADLKLRFEGFEDLVDERLGAAIADKWSRKVSIDELYCAEDGCEAWAECASEFCANHGSLVWEEK